MLYGLWLILCQFRTQLSCGWLSLLWQLSLLFMKHIRNIFKKRKTRVGHFPVKSRGICQFWHSALPCALGMLPCLHYCHTGQESAAERGLVESLSENTHTRRGLLSIGSPPPKPKPVALRRRCHAGEEVDCCGSDLGKKGKVNKKDERRHNRQDKLWEWRSDSLATESWLPGKNRDSVSWQWRQSSTISTATATFELFKNCFPHMACLGICIFTNRTRSLNF